MNRIIREVYPLDSSQHDSLKHTLKEWAVTVRALERGDTALVVRKGGIREKAFAVKDQRFLLLPGYEHQSPELLKPEYRELLREIPDLTDEGPLCFTSFAEVRGAYEISEPASLAAIDPYHVWTPEYVESRFRWRPKKPLTVLVLRTYLLPEPAELPYSEYYSGCKSWIELAQRVSTAGARPALEDESFERLVAPALAALRGLKLAPVGS
jgi:hypothetical protein